MSINSNFAYLNGNLHIDRTATAPMAVSDKATLTALLPREPSTKDHMTHTNHLGL